MQSITLLCSIYNILFSLSLSCHIYSRHQSLGCTRVMMIIWTRGDPPLPHSFILLPGPAIHGSNLPLQHHLVTTAVIQEAFTQLTEEEGGERKINPVLTIYFPRCPVIPLLSSGWCLNPVSFFRDDVSRLFQPGRSTNMTYALLFYTTHWKSEIVGFLLPLTFINCVLLAIWFLLSRSVWLQSGKLLYYNVNNM